MIRRATMDDIEILTNVAEDVLADLPNYASAHVNKDHSRAMLRTFLGLEDLGCFFEEKDGEIVGLFMAMVHPQWFTPCLEMSELMFWVRKDQRRTSLARDLLKVAEEWAVSRGAKKLLIAAGSGYETERVVKFYQRYGYEPWSVITCKEVQ